MMAELLLLGGPPLVAAAAAFVLMDRPWWLGGLVLVAIIALLYLLPTGPGYAWVTWVFFAALAAIVGWFAAVIGTWMTADESLVAATVYAVVFVFIFLVWAIVPDGSF